MIVANSAATRELNEKNERIDKRLFELQNEFITLSRKYARYEIDYDKYERQLALIEAEQKRLEAERNE